MATKAMARKIFMNPQEFSIIGRAFVSPGLTHRTSTIIPYWSPVVRTVFTASPGLIDRIRKDREDVELQDRKLQVDEQQRLLQEVEELTTFRRSLLYIQHHRGGGEGIINFTTAASIRRLALQHRLGPYILPRQAVEGVVCITTPLKDASLLYNPTTRNTSHWIETTTTREVYGGGKARCQVESIALGFDPQSKKHKVIWTKCLLKKTDNETLVVEVLTVGDHAWRELVDAPPAYSSGGRFAFVDGPLYMKRIEYILEFDVGTEEFAYTPLGRRLKKDLPDSLQQVRSVMMEIDGNVAILMSTPDEQQTSSLWICHELSKDGHMRWRDEKVLIPYDYVCPGSSIVALTETDFIFIQSHDGRISCYNRKTNKSVPIKIPTAPIPDHFDWGRIIKL